MSIPTKWTDHTAVRPSDTDINGIASSTFVLRYMQDAAFNQHFHCGPSLDSLRKSGRAYILSRVAMRSYKPLYAGDKIEAQSWACPSRGMSFMRCARIIREGETVAELTSQWAYVDITTRRLLRVETADSGFGTEEPIEIDAPLRFTIPSEIELCTCGKRIITYSDADENGHMNNTVYPDMLCDFLPESNSDNRAALAAMQTAKDGGFTIHRDHRPALTGKRVSALSISFLTDARIGETLDILHGTSADGVHYFRTKHEGGEQKTGIEARMVIEDITAE